MYLERASLLHDFLDRIVLLGIQFYGFLGRGCVILEKLPLDLLGKNLQNFFFRQSVNHGIGYRIAKFRQGKLFPA